MVNQVTNQLLNEIQKIKNKDYSSYQKFYEETSRYLYEIIWKNVQNKENADNLLKNLYKDIYATIAVELIDNNKFYEWAGNKAEAMSVAYRTSQDNLSEEDEDTQKNQVKEAVGVATATAVIDATVVAGVMKETAGVLEGGIGGTEVISLGTSGIVGGVSEAGVAGMETASSVVGAGAANAGLGNAASGIAQSGLGTVSGGIGTVGSSTAATVATKVGLGIGAKIAIGITTAAIVVGGSIGVWTVVKNKNKNTNKTTEVTTETTVASVDTETTEALTDTTTEAEDTYDAELVERYSAYYDLVKQYMEKYETHIIYDTANIIGFSSAQLVDFNGTGKEQLLIVHSRVNNLESILSYEARSYGGYIEIYDYIDGEVVLVDTLDYKTSWGLGYATYYIKDIGDGRYGIATYTFVDDADFVDGVDQDPDMANYEEKFNYYEYIDGKMKLIHYCKTTCRETPDWDYSYQEYYIDDNEVEQDAFEAQISLDKESADEYVTDLTTMVIPNYCLLISRPIMEKHKTINKLATVCGDEEFVNYMSDVDYSVQSEINKLKFETGINKYNESFGFDNMYVSYEVSADGKSVSVNYSDECYPWYCNFTYVDDTLVCVGGAYKDDGDGSYNCYFWADIDTIGMPDVYELVPPYGNAERNAESIYEVSEDEYNEKSKELMTR